MKQLLNFLEKELEVPFQFALLEQETKVADNRIVKTCYSKTHNTRHICVKLFYKKTF
jgi:hypothetical protein